MSFKRKILLYSLLMTLTIAITTTFCIFETQNEKNTETFSQETTHQTSVYSITHQENIGNETSYYFFSNFFIPSFAANCPGNEIQVFSKIPSQYSLCNNLRTQASLCNQTITTHPHRISFVIKDLSSHLCRWLIYI